MNLSFNVIENYILYKQYPPNVTKITKRQIRNASMTFFVDKGILYKRYAFNFT